MLKVILHGLGVIILGIVVVYLLCPILVFATQLNFASEMDYLIFALLYICGVAWASVMRISSKNADD